MVLLNIDALAALHNMRDPVEKIGLGVGRNFSVRVDIITRPLHIFYLDTNINSGDIMITRYSLISFMVQHDLMRYIVIFSWFFGDPNFIVIHRYYIYSNLLGGVRTSYS